MIKLNCWEFMRCGRETGGSREKDLGRCPAFTFTTFHGTNGGFRSGRYCWFVAGTFQDGEPACNSAETVEDCSQCSFFERVRKEEGSGFVL
ncbi:MAG: two-CW domain-containing protein [Fidelibacterota bacterium]